MPDLAHFSELAAKHRVVPVMLPLLADLTSPVAAFLRLCGNDSDGRPGFLLESVDHGGRWSRWSFVGRDPRARIVASGGEVAVTGELPADLPLDGGVLATLEALLRPLQGPRRDRADRRFVRRGGCAAAALGCRGVPQLRRGA
ncbi:MAG: hypothetical protein M5U19_15880 [Microthrixaceae bacterium]|nr:hypothetical protein [Microthrixaceae bacterium]